MQFFKTHTSNFCFNIGQHRFETINKYNLNKQLSSPFAKNQILDLKKNPFLTFRLSVFAK